MKIVIMIIAILLLLCSSLYGADQYQDVSVMMANKQCDWWDYSCGCNWYDPWCNPPPPVPVPETHKICFHHAISIPEYFIFYKNGNYKVELKNIVIKSAACPICCCLITYKIFVGPNLDIVNSDTVSNADAKELIEEALVDSGGNATAVRAAMRNLLWHDTTRICSCGDSGSVLLPEIVVPLKISLKFWEELTIFIQKVDCDRELPIVSCVSFEIK